MYCINSVDLFIYSSTLSRVGYRVRYFLGTDRIASIPPSIEKRLVVRYQISIPKGLISSTSVRQKACSTRCVRLEAARRRLIHVWHPRERFETIRISLLSTSHVSFTTHRLKRTRGDFSVCRLNEDINTWTTTPELLWESLYEYVTIWFE